MADEAIKRARFALGSGVEDWVEVREEQEVSGEKVLVIHAARAIRIFPRAANAVNIKLGEA